MHGKNNLTPFEGHETTANPVATIVRGQIMMRDGELVGEPRGQMIKPLSAKEQAAAGTADKERELVTA